MAKRTILSIHNTTDLYGASRSLLALAEHWIDEGHRVHVLLPGTGLLADRLRTLGVSVHHLRKLAVVQRPSIIRPLDVASFFLRLVVSVTWVTIFIGANEIDLVHTNSAVVPVGGIAAWLTSRRHIWHIREFFTEFRCLWLIYQRFMYCLSDTIIAVSFAVREQFDQTLWDRCEVIYNALDERASTVDLRNARDFRSQLGNPDLLVGVVGRIKLQRKGQDVFVRAISIIKDEFPKARFVIVGTHAPGNEDHTKLLANLVHELGLDTRVKFTGDIEDMPSVYAALDLSVVPSVFPEPFGRVVSESMAVGVPVVGSRCGGISEQIADGQTGYLFRPGDANDLADSMRRILSDPALRTRLGAAGAKRLKEKFSKEVSDCAFDALVNKL